jgi:hypothetical protein
MTTDALATDPAVRTAVRTALALLFLWTGMHKLRDVSAFRAAMANYRLVPMGVVDLGAGALIGAELVTALTLMGTSSALPAGVAAALLLLYSLAIAVNLCRGRHYIDCGCAGPAARQPISGDLILRNMFIAIAAAATALPSTGRALLWMDAVTITGGVIVLALLYITFDTLLSNSTLEVLKRRRPQTLTASRPRGLEELRFPGEA